MRITKKLLKKEAVSRTDMYTQHKRTIASLSPTRVYQDEASHNHDFFFFPSLVSLYFLCCYYPETLTGRLASSSRPPALP